MPDGRDAAVRSSEEMTGPNFTQKNLSESQESAYLLAA